MIELAVRLAPATVEPLLDQLLPLAPRGVAERHRDGEVELGFLEPSDELRAALPAHLRREERELPDDWRARRLATYEPLVVAGRVALRPAWAPPAPSGLLDLVLEQDGPFGDGTHPTTRACLALLLDLPVAGSLADLGCGTGVLAIAAAKLGWAPVDALDANEEVVAAARHNAAANRIELDVRCADLFDTGPPPATALMANVPAIVQVAIAERLSDATRFAVLSGFSADEAGPVEDAWADAGLRKRVGRAEGGWAVLALERR